MGVVVVKFAVWLVEGVFFNIDESGELSKES